MLPRLASPWLCIILPLFPKYWCYRCVSSHQWSSVTCFCINSLCPVLQMGGCLRSCLFAIVEILCWVKSSIPCFLLMLYCHRDALHSGISVNTTEGLTGVIPFPSFLKVTYYLQGWHWLSLTPSPKCSRIPVRLVDEDLRLSRFNLYFILWC